MSGTRRKPGRLGSYVNGYRAWLLELGYAPASVTRSLGAMGHVGRWMERHDIDAEQLNADALNAFLADHVDRHGQLPSAGVMPLTAARPCTEESTLLRAEFRYREGTRDATS